MQFTNTTFKRTTKTFNGRKVTERDSHIFTQNDKPAFGYIVFIDDQPAYRGSGIIKAYNAVFHRRFETDLEFSLHNKGLGHLKSLEHDQHINPTLQKIWDNSPTKLFRIELVATYTTRTEALAVELNDIRTGHFATNVVGAPGQTRYRPVYGKILTADEVQQIKSLLTEGVKQVPLAKQFNVSQTVISKIANDKHKIAKPKVKPVPNDENV